jgi:hypothetical protein
VPRNYRAQQNAQDAEIDDDDGFVMILTMLMMMGLPST